MAGVESIVKTQPSVFFDRSISRPNAGPPDPEPGAPDGAPVVPPDVSCFGWLVVLGSFTVHVWAVGIFYSFGIFVIPLEQQFGVSRGTVSWINGLGSFMMLTSGILTGHLADHWSYRGCVLVGALLIVVALELSSITTAVWQLFLTYGIVQGVGAGFCFIPAVSAVTQWFQKRRGLATGLAVSGSGVGTLALPLAGQALINALGWRWTMRCFGFMCLFFLPLASLVIRRREHVHRSRWVGLSVIRTRTFLFLAPAIFLYSMGFLIPIVHLVPNAQDKGIGSSQALLSAVGAASTIGRIVLGFTADKLGKVNVLKGSLLVLTVATPFWPFLSNLWETLIFAVVFGFAAGSFIALVAPTAIAGVAGLIYALCAVGNLLGPSLAGIMYDHYGNYQAAAFFSASCTGAGFLFLWGLPSVEEGYANYLESERRRDLRLEDQKQKQQDKKDPGL